MLSFNNTNITLINLKAIFQEIAESHYQINCFGWGPAYDITANEIKNYPLLWVIEQPGIDNEDSLIYKFRVIYMDLVDKNPDINETTIQSDARLVLRDVQMILRDGYGLGVVFGSTSTPFTEAYTDRDAGRYADISIETPNNFSGCDAPYVDKFY